MCYIRYWRKFPFPTAEQRKQLSLRTLSDCCISSATPVGAIQFPFLLCWRDMQVQHTQSRLIPPSPFRDHSFLLPKATIVPVPPKPFTVKEELLGAQFCVFALRTSRNVGKRRVVWRVRGEVKEQSQKVPAVVVKRAYPFHEIEPKWQRYWQENKTFRTPDEIDPSKPKFYVLDMFPYPRSLSISLTLRSWIMVVIVPSCFLFAIIFSKPYSDDFFWWPLAHLQMALSCV